MTGLLTFTPELYTNPVSGLLFVTLEQTEGKLGVILGAPPPQHAGDS